VVGVGVTTMLDVNGSEVDEVNEGTPVLIAGIAGVVGTVGVGVEELGTTSGVEIA
jgi:hypothetical protein